MDFKNLSDNEVNTLAPHIFKYSIPIMQYYNRDKNYFGSVTLIRIGSRFFVATAGHNLAGAGIPGVSRVVAPDAEEYQAKSGKVLPVVCSSIMQVTIVLALTLIHDSI
jgi:hypothetical protein